ncbi:putative bifunctional diguanylate cyclase/phosphodiesterase [Stenotrophomonas maltophilia]|uniref:putative bifunctional diguanylate cyclase/phosphodiesterase n=1 Tax=Stenotrophomonas maltophilia TaxID=40324 RepID=UPI0039C0820A
MAELPLPGLGGFRVVERQSEEALVMTDRAVDTGRGALKFRGAARREKVSAILSLAGISCICLGLAWTSCYLYFGRAELSIVFVGLIAVGILALLRSKRSDGASILIVAHGVLVAVCAIAAIDAPIAGVPRSVHLFLLPLAAGAAFTFEARERYGSQVFPLLCLAVFAAFALGTLDRIAPGISPPVEVRHWGARFNTTISMVLLAAIFGIYRLDIGKRLRLERELGRAVRNGEIEVHYQPQVHVQSGVIGVEALVRWRHPSGGMLSPDAFIPLAEESALIDEIGLEVLRQACELLAGWSGQLHTRGMRVAVNISPIQLLSEAFVPSVAKLVNQSGINPALLELELTESALSADTAEMIERMLDLQALGVTWALDDFGTGYSSLSTLRTLPIRKLKIDRQFVQEVTSQESAQRLLGKIVEISEVMGMSALAEGVETAEQRDLLISLGCEYFQGYFFARPMPLPMLNAWMKERRSLSVSHRSAEIERSRTTATATSGASEENCGGVR